MAAVLSPLHRRLRMSSQHYSRPNIPQTMQRPVGSEASIASASYQARIAGDALRTGEHPKAGHERLPL